MQTTNLSIFIGQPGFADDFFLQNDENISNFKDPDFANNTPPISPKFRNLIGGSCSDEYDFNQTINKLPQNKQGASCIDMLQEMKTAGTLDNDFQSPFQTSSKDQQCIAEDIISCLSADFEYSQFSGQPSQNDQNIYGHLNSKEPEESQVDQYQGIYPQHDQQNFKDGGPTQPRQNGLLSKRNYNQRDIKELGKSFNKSCSCGSQQQSQAQTTIFQVKAFSSQRPKNLMNGTQDNDAFIYSLEAFYHLQKKINSQPQKTQFTTHLGDMHHPTIQQEQSLPQYDQTSQLERPQKLNQQLNNQEAHIGQYSYQYQIGNTCQNSNQIVNSTSIQGYQTDVFGAHNSNTIQQLIGSNDNHSVDHNKNKLSVQNNQISGLQPQSEQEHIIVPNPSSENGSSIGPCHTNKRVIKEETKKAKGRGRGRPAINILASLDEKQPEAKDIKSALRRWRKLITKDLLKRSNNPDSHIRTILLLTYGEEELQRFVDLIHGEGKYKAHSVKLNGVSLWGSSIKPGKELSQEEEERDIVGLLISSYNLRRLQKFFNKEMHREAFRLYKDTLSVQFKGNDALLEVLEFIIRVSYKIEHLSISEGNV
eukprot:403332611